MTTEGAGFDSHRRRTHFFAQAFLPLAHGTTSKRYQEKAGRIRRLVRLLCLDEKRIYLRLSMCVQQMERLARSAKTTAKWLFGVYHRNYGSNR
jgi:hypothetical protein